jgi:hypothetical protein
MARSDTARLTARIALAPLLGFGAMFIATRLDPRFSPEFATWLSAASARVPYMADEAEADTLIAALLAGACFVFLSFGRGRRSAWSLAAVAVAVAIFTVARTAGDEEREAEAVVLGQMPAAVTDHPSDPPCESHLVTSVRGARLATIVTCAPREGAPPDEALQRQRLDDMAASDGNGHLRVQRLCVTSGAGTVCRWRAGPEDPTDDARALAFHTPDEVVALDARSANADDVLVVEGLPDFAAFRVRDPAGQSWTFASASGREVLSPMLAGHRPGAHLLGALAVVVAVGGALAALAAAALVEQRLRRAHRYASARGGTVEHAVIAFADGSAARIVGDAPPEGAVTLLAGDAGAAAYRDPELVEGARLEAGTPQELAQRERCTADRYRALLLAIVALTTTPVAVAWCRAPIPLPPLPLAQVQRAL